MINKFEEAKNKLVLKAANYAAQYLLSKYGSAHLTGEPKVDLKATDGPTTGSYVFTGNISVQAGVEHGQGFSNLDVNMTVNENDIEVTSEDIQANIGAALNSAENHPETVVAALDSFKLTDNGSKYLAVSHPALHEASLGIVGKNEYNASKNKAELLKTVVKDSLTRTASESASIEFTGEFKEPVIAKKADDCLSCGKLTKGHDDFCAECKEEEKMQGSFDDVESEASQKTKTSTWLTADFMNEVPDTFAQFTAILQNQYGVTPEDVGIDSPEDMQDEAPQELADRLSMKYDLTRIAKNVGIKEDMPLARASDSMSQMAQLEEQTVSASQEKIRTEAVNSLVSMLHNMGYGTAKVAEVTESKEGLDLMTTLDDAGAIKAVSIPVVVKDAKVVLPKKSLVSTLISKGLDIKAKLSEEFGKEVIEKLAAIEEKIAYEAKEAENIINERIVKTAGDEPKTQFEGTNETVLLNHHLIPDALDLDIGNVVHIDGVSYKLVSKSKDQLSKGEGDASTWVFEKVQPVATETAKKEINK